MEVGPKITFPIISPEREVAAMIHLHLICGHISAFNEPQIVHIGSDNSEEKVRV